MHGCSSYSRWSTPSEHSNIYATLMGHHHLEHKHTHANVAHTMHNSTETQHACMHSTPPSTHPAPRRDQRSSAAVQPYPKPSAHPSAHSAPHPKVRQCTLHDTSNSHAPCMRSVVMFWGSGMACNVSKRICFLLLQTLPTFWIEWIWILRVLLFELAAARGRGVGRTNGYAEEVRLVQLSIALQTTELDSNRTRGALLVI